MGFFDDVNINSVKEQQEEKTTKKEILDELLNLENTEESQPFLEEPSEIEVEMAQEDVGTPIENEPVKTERRPVKEKQQMESNKMEQNTKDTKQPHGNEKNIILSDTVITGDIATSSYIEIYGKVSGSVTGETGLYLGSQGCVGDHIRTGGNAKINGTVGNGIEAEDISISDCQVKGNIYGANVHVNKNAVVIGPIEAANDVFITGAVKGNIDAKGIVKVESSAIIQGNIRSAQVCIEPGAALDGTCTQEYAKVKPADFFAEFEEG